jgi:type IV pilus assembly protein PilN
MIRINLLPFRAARKKENIRRQLSVFALTFIFFIMAAFAWNMRLGAKISDLNNEVETTKKEVAKYRKITEKIKRIKKQLEILQKKTEVINKLQRNRFDSVKLLDTMSDKVITKRMWFTGFQNTGNKVQIKGIALDNRTVADFMTRLEGTGLFGTVKLEKIQKQVVKKSSLKNFQVTCMKKGPAQKKKSKGGKNKKK